MVVLYLTCRPGGKGLDQTQPCTHTGGGGREGGRGEREKGVSIIVCVCTYV